MISISIYNLKIDTICMCDIPFDRSILQLSNGIRHVMPSTDRKLELTAKALMTQPVSQPAVCSNGLRIETLFHSLNVMPFHSHLMNMDSVMLPKCRAAIAYLWKIETVRHSPDKEFISEVLLYGPYNNIEIYR
jgi:hypothetical protein